MVAEWRWRPYAEIGEATIARFVPEFVAERAAGGCSGGGASGSWVIIPAMVLGDGEPNYEDAGGREGLLYQKEGAWFIDGPSR